MITGGGANTLGQVTPAGVIVVDTKNPGENRYDRMMEEIKSVTDQPVKIRFEHAPPSGPCGQQQTVHRCGSHGDCARCSEDQYGRRPSDQGYPRTTTRTFAKDYVLKLGGAEVDAHAYGRGHTGDDTMIYFPDLKVVMVSDQITDGNPEADSRNSAYPRMEQIARRSAGARF